MKQRSYLLLFISILTFTACKQKETSEKEIDPAISSRTVEEDQKLLDERIAYTDKIWDSLQSILSRKDLNERSRDSVKDLFFRNREQQEEIIKDFIREHPGSKVSLEKLNGLKMTWGKETTEELFKPLHPELKSTETGRMIQRYLDFYNKPEVNDLYTDFELPDLNGDKKLISENLGSYTLLEFWASWCSGCRKEHPKLIEVYENYKDRNFTVIGISGDESEKAWKHAVEKDELPWLNLRDTTGRESIVQYQYGIHYLPANFLIGPDGIIIAKDVRPGELHEILQEKFNQEASAGI